jgi:peptidoglycan/xylan/chitin deacetylase (PgdA/CDA1 family)
LADVAGKRQQVAQALARLRLDRVALRLQSRALYVFTYHRVLSTLPSDYPFDDGVAEHTAATFEAQARWLDRHTRVLSEHELLDVVRGKIRPRGPLSVITVDDAYVDAYEILLPILESLGLPAIFFAPIDPLEHRRLGWWDLAAFVLKRSKKERVVFQGLALEPARDRRGAIVAVGTWMKTQPSEVSRDAIAELARTCDVSLPSASVQATELMTWDQLREVSRAGMAVGAHTLTHRVLDTLDEGQREREVSEPKAILERALGAPVLSIGFPGASRRPVSEATIQMAAQAGYELAFLPNAGVGRAGPCDPHRIPRIGAPTTPEALASLVAFPGLVG